MIMITMTKMSSTKPLKESAMVLPVRYLRESAQTSGGLSTAAALLLSLRQCSTIGVSSKGRNIDPGLQAPRYGAPYGCFFVAQHLYRVAEGNQVLLWVRQLWRERLRRYVKGSVHQFVLFY